MTTSPCVFIIKPSNFLQLQSRLTRRSMKTVLLPSCCSSQQCLFYTLPRTQTNRESR